jgi:hypothetical protein
MGEFLRKSDGVVWFALRRRGGHRVGVPSYPGRAACVRLAARPMLPANHSRARAARRSRSAHKWSRSVFILIQTPLG